MLRMQCELNTTPAIRLT